MKTSSYSLLCAGLISLLTVMPLLATDTGRNPDPKPSSSGWVSAPDGSFQVRTHQDPNGDLIVRVNNPSLRGLTIQMQTLRGEEVAFIPVNSPQTPFGTKFDVSELTDGDYRLIVATDTQKVTKLINLTTPTVATRRATVALVTQVSNH